MNTKDYSPFPIIIGKSSGIHYLQLGKPFQDGDLEHVEVVPVEGLNIYVENNPVCIGFADYQEGTFTPVLLNNGEEVFIERRSIATKAFRAIFRGNPIRQKE